MTSWPTPLFTSGRVRFCITRSNNEPTRFADPEKDTIPGSALSIRIVPTAAPELRSRAEISPNE